MFGAIPREMQVVLPILSSFAHDTSQIGEMMCQAYRGLAGVLRPFFACNLCSHRKISSGYIRSSSSSE
jgi:hypothetical protein